VSSGTVIDVISADDGHVLGVIPLPKGDDVISLTFGGPGKRTLYAVALNHKYAKGALGLPSDHLMGGQGGELVAIRMLAHGYEGRAK
jgi:sugar lactone lactonase YvrE